MGPAAAGEPAQAIGCPCEIHAAYGRALYDEAPDLPVRLLRFFTFVDNA